MLLAVAASKAERILRVEDLKGHTVGIGSAGGAHHRTLEYFLALHGLTISDIQLATIGVAGRAVAAFEHGKVDAGILNWSAYGLLKRRAPATRALVDPRSRPERLRVFGTEEVPAQCLMARADWLTAHRSEARALAQGMLRTMRWIREHSAEEIRARMPERLRTDMPDADLETITSVVQALSPDGRMPKGGPEVVEKVYTTSFDREKQDAIDLTQTYTNEFVEEAK
jgi:NitT/TauT family transport system substrate-binding protein